MDGYDLERQVVCWGGRLIKEAEMPPGAFAWLSSTAPLFVWGSCLAFNSRQSFVFYVAWAKGAFFSGSIRAGCSVHATHHHNHPKPRISLPVPCALYRNELF